jgi:hypothetical protein
VAFLRAAEHFLVLLLAHISTNVQRRVVRRSLRLLKAAAAARQGLARLLLALSRLQK